MAGIAEAVVKEYQILHMQLSSRHTKVTASRWLSLCTANPIHSSKQKSYVDQLSSSTNRNSTPSWAESTQHLRHLPDGTRSGHAASGISSICPEVNANGCSLFDRIVLFHMSLPGSEVQELERSVKQLVTRASSNM